MSDSEPGDPDEEPVGTEDGSNGDSSGSPTGKTTEEATTNDGLSEGDFVRLAYTARTVEDGTLVDTTDPEVAAEEGVDEEGQTFEPRTVVLGAGHLFDPVEEEILGRSIGDTGSVTVSATDAFGEYDEEQVRTVSADKIDEDDRYPGAPVQIDGEEGHLETIIGGRARVDFNHPLAGEAIEYDYEILEVIEGREAKAKALLSTYLDMELEVRIETDEVEDLQPIDSAEAESEDETTVEDTTNGNDADHEEAEEGPSAETSVEDESGEPEYEEVLVEKETLYIDSTPQLSFNQQWMFQKQQIAQEIMNRIEVDRVVVQEVIDGGGMGGMMPGMGGMMPGMGGGDVEEALEEADVDGEELAEEIENLEE